MALPIKPTPVLYGKEARDFERLVQENLHKPVKVSSPPSLEAAKELARRLFVPGADNGCQGRPGESA